MDEWLVNLIIGIASIVFGFISGFFTKSFTYKKQNKISQKAKGQNISQSIGNNYEK